MLEEIKMRSVSPWADSHIDGSVEAMPVFLLVPLWPLAVASCLCGGPLCAEGEFVACEHCRRLYCPECGGPVVHGGGCESCAVCGYGYCA